MVNEVKYEYDANGLLAKEFSNPSGAVNTSTSLYVGYSYDATKSGELFTKRLRQTSMRYPSATTINYTYGVANSVDDLLNRFTAVQNGSTNVVEYTETGLVTPAIVKYPQPNLTLDYTTSTALDRFGRITDHAWKNSSGTALVQIKHGYDRDGNRLYREDIAAANAGKSFDELYAYDGMNQLVDMQRGTLNSAKTAIASGKNYAEQFTFDATGNFANYKQDATGDGTFELNQTRTHTKANEITTIGGASTYVANDANGNMTKVVKPDNWSAAFTLVYDAWNRLVIVKDGSTTVATYFYDGLNHRIKKIVGSETRLFYYNCNWQCLEEYVGSTCDARYVWGLRYIDDLVTYRKGSTDYYSVADPNWNVVTLLNTSGVVQERYTYSAFGKANIFDANFTTRSNSSCSITRTFTGQVLDAETGLMLYRNRVYHTTLGRFIQRDPIAYDAGDVNLMRNAGNMSAIASDPMGTVAIVCTCETSSLASGLHTTHTFEVETECTGGGYNCCKKACNKGHSGLPRTPVDYRVKNHWGQNWTLDVNALCENAAKSQKCCNCDIDKCKENVAKLLEIAKSTKSTTWFNKCQSWGNNFKCNRLQKLPQDAYSCFNINEQWHNYPIRSFGTEINEWWNNVDGRKKVYMGHYISIVTMCDGAKFCLDNGWVENFVGDGIFPCEHIPSYLTPGNL